MVDSNEAHRIHNRYFESMATRSMIIITGNVQLFACCFGSVNGYMRGKSWHWNRFTLHQYSDEVEPERGVEPFDCLRQSLTCPLVLYICHIIRLYLARCTIVGSLFVVLKRSILTCILLC